MKNYIGLGTSPHDPSLSIVNSSGELVYAESTERLLQTKRAWGSNPDHINHIDAIVEKYCDPDIDTIVASTWSKKKKGRYRFVLPFLNFRYIKSKPSERLGLSIMKYATGAHVSVLGLAGSGIDYAFAEKKSRIYRQYFDHHLTHAANAAFCSQFEDAMCVIIDGFGEKGSVAAFEYNNGCFRQIKKIKSRMASFGVFYSSLCSACGFNPAHGEEWKLMGLAAYGKFDKDIYDLIRPILDVSSTVLRYGKNSFQCLNELREMRRKNNVPAIEYADFAATAQMVFSEYIIEYLKNTSEFSNTSNLVLCGGCALNSSTNGLILSNTPFKELYVNFAPADDGNSIGAAYLSFFADNPQKKPSKKLQSPYLGSEISDGELARLNRYGGLKRETVNDEEVFKRIARVLAQGEIVGWVQGKAEFGPRALGNRSILADPRSANMKEKINADVKFREEFRPFAPSIMHEYGEGYFEDYQFSPYMERTLKFKSSVMAKVPAVVHEDGTGRLQSVTADLNYRYYRLIEEFYDITGIPVLLNTSFNVMGKPIIHSIEDAIAVFLTSGLDVLVVGNTIYSKNEV